MFYFFYTILHIYGDQTAFRLPERQSFSNSFLFKQMIVRATFG